MNFDYDTIMLLAVFTLGAGLVIGVISWLRARRAQDHHEDAAVAERQRHEDPAAPIEGTPGDIDPTVSDHRGDPTAAPARSRDGVPVAPSDSGRSWSKERGNNPPTPIPPRD
ncbi:hypothetical protein [Erythrobacter donghaensis]|jgi:hypothetical protein|uniref:hypothetical protein n=1 Tax=Erythrobacter donghaensis TaxID=267135 RepID=UPI0009401943|nr:hypothetical protein [Erythrobacter donghaensis]